MQSTGMNSTGYSPGNFGLETRVECNSSDYCSMRRTEESLYNS